MALPFTVRRESVTLKRVKFDLKRGLLSSPVLPWVPIAIDSAEARETVTSEVPVDGREIVEWMHYCLPKGHFVPTFNGLKDIDQIKVGEKVLTHKGEFKPVSRTFRRRYKGKLVGLKLVGYSDTIYLTPSHPILVGFKHLRGSGYHKRVYEIKYIPAGSLKIPKEKVMAGSYKSRAFALMPLPKPNGESSLSLPLSRFLGYYLSEGCAYHREKYRSYVIDLSNRDQRIIEDMAKCVQEAFGKEPNIRENERVQFWSKEIYLWLKENFGCNCYEKRVPGWILTQKDEVIENLLETLWLGDGSSQPRGGYDRKAYHTSSKELALAVRLLYARLGKETTIARRHNPEAYIVYVNNPDGKEASYPQVRIRNGYLWMPIEDIALQEFDGDVFNLEVQGDNSYIAETFAVHNCAADNAVFSGMAEEYNRLASELLSGSGDPYIPGVKVGNIRGESVLGSTVSARGYGTVITPKGNFNVPVGGKATFAKEDILAWAALPKVDPVQWVLTLLQWLDLAVAPIKERVRFASSNGLVAPNFFSVSPRLPVPMATMRIGFTSDKPQTIMIKGRGTKGSFEDVIFEDKFDIDTGESEVIYTVFGFPLVPSFTLELQPANNTMTVLDYLEVFP